MPIERKPLFGAVVASGPAIRNQQEARWMIQALERALADMAGTAAEPKLAEWHRAMVETRRRAQKESWVGWDQEPTSSPEPRA